MSQHDFNIANQGFPATRADINNAFQAIASNSSGPTAPSTTYANMWWYDTTNNKMYLRNAADTAWIEVAVLDQTNNEWIIKTGVVQAKDSDGLKLNTDDGTTRLFIKDADGAVGIGTASPSNTLHVTNSSSTVATGYFNNTSGSGDSPALIVQGGANNAGTSGVFEVRDYGGNTDFFVNGVGNIGVGTTSPANKMHFVGTSATPDLRLGSSSLSYYWDIGRENVTTGDFLFLSSYAGTVSERLRILQGGGLTFNGDTAAGNALDDYEEGSFTLATTDTGYTISSSLARYTKIGGVVIVNFRVQFSAVGSQNSNCTFNSVLPYTSNASTDFDGSIREQTATGAIYVSRIGANSTDITINSMDGVGTGQQRTIRANEKYTGTLVYYV